MSEVDRKSYPKDVTDEEWSFVLPYLLLSREDSLSRKHSLRELFNGVQYIVRTGNQLMLPERLTTLKGLTPYEYPLQTLDANPDRFTLNPIHQMLGLKHMEHGFGVDGNL